MPSDAPVLGILLLSGTHDRAHYAFVMAAGAAALGRTVVLFATNDGCRALAVDWSAIDPQGRDAVALSRGVAGFAELRDAAGELGVRLLACEAGLRMAAMDQAALIAGVEVAGVATFLAAVGSGQIMTL